MVDQSKDTISPTDGKARKIVLNGESSHIPVIKKNDSLLITNSGGLKIKNCIIWTTPIIPASECKILENQFFP